MKTTKTVKINGDRVRPHRRGSRRFEKGEAWFRLDWRDSGRCEVCVSLCVEAVLQVHTPREALMAIHQCIDVSKAWWHKTTHKEFLRKNCVNTVKRWRL